MKLNKFAFQDVFCDTKNSESINNNNINYDYDDEHFQDDLTFDRLLWSDSSAYTTATAAAAFKNKNNINYDYDDEHFKDDLTFY